MRTTKTARAALALTTAVVMLVPLTSVAAGSSCQGCGENLIRNGDAETGGGGSGAAVITPDSWETEGNLRAELYGQGGYPETADVQGNSDPGTNFFAGGPSDPESSATQTIQVWQDAGRIDAAAISYDFSAWVGGWQTHDDTMTITADFQDGRGRSLAQAQLGPVTAADRGGTTLLLPQQTSGQVPTGTRQITITMLAERAAGSANDGYADDLSLILTDTGSGTACLSAGPGPDCPVGGEDQPQPARTVELDLRQQLQGTFATDFTRDNQTRVIDVDGVLLGTLVGQAEDPPCPQAGDPYWVIDTIDESGGSGFFTSCTRGEVPATFTPTFDADGELTGLSIEPEGIGPIGFFRSRPVVHVSGTTGQDVALGVGLLWADTFWNDGRGLRQGVERLLFVATDTNFADNLAMAGVTGQARGLALQISPTDRDANLAAISRLRPDRLVVVGGQAALPDSVLPDDVPIDRVAGANRFDTAVQMARSFYPNGTTTVMVATGGNFPDAVAAGARASLAKTPMLLVDGARMPSETLAELQRLSPDRIIVLGGPAVVPESIEEQLSTLATTVERYEGANRMATAAEVSRQTNPDGADVVYVANGNEFNNALTAASNAWLFGGPLLLTRPTSLPDETAEELARLKPDHVFVVSDRFEFDARVHAEIATALAD